jgi:predicted enzyme related to lactoylglutathione lyase
VGSIIVALAAAWASARFVRPAEGTPAYAEFRIGDYQHELGIVDSRFAPHGRPGQAGGAVIYWHVDDVRASVERLASMGAVIREEPVERGPGFVTASVIDPFGNILGVMYNQHYLEILTSRAGA